ncbi:MAG: multicopper oxidase domain-containing protein [Gammaproteobacteria bacterium]|nr:multicopper oxidase domain-containing protein [Gammaproteobacteria bacterium]
MSGPPALAQAHSNVRQPAAEIHADVSYTLKTDIGNQGMTFVGVGQSIDGVVNPTLNAKKGDIVQITLIDGDGAEHDISFPDFNALSDHVVGPGASTVIVFRADRDGSFKYFCTLPGHRAAGMEGTITIGAAAAAAAGPALANISRNPAELPAPIARTRPAHVEVKLVAEEVKGRLADDTGYNFWTFNGKVPGPMLRVRVGDTVTLTLENRKDSRMIHSVDLHAVTGPGGGAALLQVPPGQSKTITFKALKPGLFVYHCATPMVANHIANGMYGMILVEPRQGLPRADEEFYGYINHFEERSGRRKGCARSIKV